MRYFIRKYFTNNQKTLSQFKFTTDLFRVLFKLVRCNLTNNLLTLCQVLANKINKMLTKERIKSFYFENVCDTFT